jgi:hypothetical protein
MGITGKSTQYMGLSPAKSFYQLCGNRESCDTGGDYNLDKAVSISSMGITEGLPHDREPPKPHIYRRNQGP